jgi:tRNA A-37 threonylcarbamoyl transferase component Bud32
MSIRLGTRVADRYTVRRSIGSGGMGGVYEIEGDALKNRLALKIIRSDLMDQEIVRQRFRREARIQSTLSHPGIARVFDFLEHEGQLGIVMELVDAPTLQDKLSAGALPPPVAREVMFELISALMAAHDAGIVHRDLKPANIFVQTDSAGTNRCKLIDFGIAKPIKLDTTGNVREQLTQTLAFVGTYAYASPEQVGRGVIDERTDLYSAGVVLWEMLAGVSPYSDIRGAFEIQSAVINMPLPSLPDDIPEDLARLVAELTRKDPDERPQSAGEVLSALRAVSAQGVPQPARGRKGMATTVILTGPAPAVTPPVQSVPAQTVAQPVQSTPAVVERFRPASARRRAKARWQDEKTPMWRLFLVVGVFAYPKLALRRGREVGGSLGQQKQGLVLCTADRRHIVSPMRRFARNSIDFMLFGIPLMMVVCVLGIISFFPAVIGAIWLATLLSIDAMMVMSDSEGRRLVDRIAGTRVCERP